MNIMFWDYFLRIKWDVSRVLAQLLVRFLCAFVLGVASVLGAMHISDFWYLWHQDLAAGISRSQTLLLAKPGLALQLFTIPLLTVMRWRVRQSSSLNFVLLCHSSVLERNHHKHNRQQAFCALAIWFGIFSFRVCMCLSTFCFYDKIFRKPKARKDLFWLTISDILSRVPNILTEERVRTR